MGKDKIINAFKEAIFESVDKLDYDQVERLTKIMKLTSESFKSTSVSEPEPTVDNLSEFDYSVPANEVENFLIEIVKEKTLTSNDATNLFYAKYKSKFTKYDLEKNHRGEERWKTRFWNIAHSLRKNKVFMPHSGKFVKKYALVKNNVAEN